MNSWTSISQNSFEELKALQDQKLYQFINKHVYPFSPYYRALFDQNKINPRHIRTVEDLRHIPMTSKLNFLTSSQRPDQYRDFILQPDVEKIRQHWPKGKLLQLAVTKVFKGEEYVKAQLGREYRPIFMTLTTGTTNTPVPFLYSNHDIQNLNLSGSRMLELFQIQPNDRIVNIFPFAPHLAFWQVVFGALSSQVFALSTGGGKVMGTQGNLTAICRIKPQIILGVPAYIYHLLRFAQEQKTDLSFVQKIILGAAKVTIPFKERLAELLRSMGAKDVKVLGTYGFTESRCAWGECPTSLDVSSGYHLYPDKEIFEVVDPKTGEVKKPGEDGELVYTALDARASVVIRYRTGDFIKGGLMVDPCPHCGLRVPRISSDITRLSDNKDLQLSKVKGSLVNLNCFDEVLSGLTQIDEWQIEIRKRNNDPYDVDELAIYCSTKNGTNTAQLEEDLKNKILHATEVSPNEVKFLPFAEMVKRLEIETANKEKRVIDIRPKI